MNALPLPLLRELAEEDARLGDFGRRAAIGEPKNPMQQAYAEAFDIIIARGRRLRATD